jgi:hypothetical protein
LISISPWTAKQAVLVGSHLLLSAVKSKARPQLAVLTEKIWEGEPSVSAKLRNALPAVAVAVAVAAAAAAETGAAAVETGVAAVETDVVAVETDAAVAAAAVAGAAASKMALETDFSRSPKIAPSLKDSLSNAIWRCKVVPCRR